MGFEFHEPNYKDIAPRIGATYRLNEKTVLRAGYGIYYNPNQMNTFTFLTNNPPLAAEITFTSDQANPTLSFERPFGVAGPGGPPDVVSPTRHLPNAQKISGASTFSGSSRRARRLTCNTSDRTRVTWIEAFSTTRRNPAGSGGFTTAEPELPLRRVIQNDLIADYDGVSVIFRRRMSHGFQADAHYTWSRTRDMATHSNGGGQVMNNYDIWADYGPANWDIPHRFVASYIYDLPFFTTRHSRS